MLPVVTLGIGTWIGLGRPDARTAVAAGVRAATSIARPAREPPPSLVPPLDQRPPTIDPGVLPDPAPPWPHLNPEAGVERAWLISEGPAHPPGDGRRLVTFTFDDGPFPETAPTVLRILDEHRIRATFFFIGEYLVGDDRRAIESREWARRIAAAGHLVGNHTFDHKKLTALSHAAALAEIDDSAAAIERAVGKRPYLFRPPYGALDDWLEDALRDRHLELLLWNIDVQDIKEDDASNIARALEDQLQYKQGGIVLLHDMHWPSVKALNRLLRRLESAAWDPKHPERRGWDIVDLPEYLRATAASPQPYGTREELERVRQRPVLRPPEAGSRPD
jgi:peptidoglycan/xylan/chitin deacetylase (PgdA/CDA1 family)